MMLHRFVDSIVLAASVGCTMWPVIIKATSVISLLFDYKIIVKNDILLIGER